MPRIKIISADIGDIDQDEHESASFRRIPKPATAFSASPRPRRPRHRADGSEEFKCGHCRAFIGPTVSGGRHRNHCPLCLWSRHVDHGRPGDRRSECRAMMAPVGVTTRPDGEQMLLHRCLGCGIVRRNRIAADDNPDVGDGFESLREGAARG